MDSSELIHVVGQYIIEDTCDQLSSQGSRGRIIFGDPQVHPHVGDEYQAEIPRLLTESERLELSKNPVESDFMVYHSFAIGLPIPMTWIHSEAGSVNLEQVEFVGDPHLRVWQNEEPNLEHAYSSKHCTSLPGWIDSSWSGLELESFLLGLYIFGKNLSLVQKIVESKDMGDIQTYYYGKFYRSDRYRRWSDRLKSKKSILGQKIFGGIRHQAVLSRLLSRTPDECQSTLLEVSRKFADGKLSLEDYVFSLKATVGMNNLTEAIAIGKGKLDITGMIDSVKTNQAISIRQEIPTGKEWHSLTSGEIVKFLTGDYRLSKTRSNDLFWEAVWPRLLARGWNSVKHSSKNNLLFLVPGVKKFRKKRHVKGEHYFDSVTDILNKIAADPGLLDIETEAPGGSDGGDKNGSSDHQRHSYLQPPSLTRNSDTSEFLVIDTCLCYEEGPFRVSEMRTLPVETTVTSTATSLSGKTDKESSEEPEDEPESATLLVGASTDLSGCLVGVPKEKRSRNNGMDNTSPPVDIHKDQHPSSCNDKNTKKTIQRQLSQRRKPGQSNCSAPITKRRRLTACEHSETNRRKNVLAADNELIRENPCGPLGSSQEKISAGSSSKGSPDDSSEGIVSENCVANAESSKKAKPLVLIDLNLPVAEAFEMNEPFTTEVSTGSQLDPNAKESFSLVERNQLENSHKLKSTSPVNEEEQPAGNGRRHSTRNRPLTTKALEALANGFLGSTKQKRKGTEDIIPRTPRRVRGKIGATENKDVAVSTGNLDSKLDGVDEECSSNIQTNKPGSSQVQSERSVGLELLLGPPNHSFHLSKDREYMPYR